MISAALGWLYPERCSLCRTVGLPTVCQECEAQMWLASPPQWDVPPLSFRAGVYVYRGRAAQAVRRLKYSRSTALAEFMASALAPRIAELARAGDLVVPVPIHWHHRSYRGFNQSELLCRGDHGRTVDCGALTRIRRTVPQASLPVAERGENLLGAFAADAGRVQGRRILLVDDVVTTGHTARACAEVLIAAGATEVGVLAFASVDDED